MSSWLARSRHLMRDRSLDRQLAGVGDPADEARLRLALVRQLMSPWKGLVLALGCGLAAGFGVYAAHVLGLVQFRIVFILVFIALWLVPLSLCERRVQRRTLRQLLSQEGRCIDCGYPLKGGLPRCPECGLQRKRRRRRFLD